MRKIASGATNGSKNETQMINTGRVRGNGSGTTKGRQKTGWANFTRQGKNGQDRGANARKKETETCTTTHRQIFERQLVRPGLRQAQHPAVRHIIWPPPMTASSVPKDAGAARPTPPDTSGDMPQRVERNEFESDHISGAPGGWTYQTNANRGIRN